MAIIFRTNGGYLNLEYLIAATPEATTPGAWLVTMERGDPRMLTGDAATALCEALDRLARAAADPPASPTTATITGNLKITQVEDPAALIDPG
jgi:hypothetical protein